MARGGKGRRRVGGVRKAHRFQIRAKETFASKFGKETFAGGAGGAGSGQRRAGVAVSAP
jgi:hypothetical protein